MKYLHIFSVISAMLFASSGAFAFTVTTGGTSVAGEGIQSSVLGAITQDFNASLLDPAGYVGGGVVLGSAGGLWASPPNDTSNYWTTGPSTSVTTTDNIGFLSSYFGYYGGSPDTYNSIEFFNGGQSVGNISGTQLAAFASVASAGDQSIGVYWNIFASNPGEYFNTVVFTSTQNAFETDNHAVLSAVPEPETYAMFLAGLGLMGFMARRCKNG